MIHTVLSLLLLLQFLQQFRELTVPIHHQLLRTAEFLDSSKTQNQYFVTFYDGIKPVRNSQHRRVSEGGFNQFLYLLLGDHINIGCCLI